ncbi:MAG: hypothetical protein ACPLXR_00895 [Halothiobacillaceae bacterium]
MAIGRVSSFRDVSERRRAEALMAVEKRVLEMVVGGDAIAEALTVLARSLEELSGQMFCAILFRESEEATTFSISTGRGLPKTYAEILAAGLVCGAEALLRWQRPEVGLIPPGVFVPLLEEVGLIDQVGKRSPRACSCSIPGMPPRCCCASRRWG